MLLSATRTHKRSLLLIFGLATREQLDEHRRNDDVRDRTRRVERARPCLASESRVFDLESIAYCE